MGQMSPVVAAATEAAAPVGKISAATTRPLGPKWENSVSDGGGGEESRELEGGKDRSGSKLARG